MGARLASYREADECVGTIGLLAKHVLGAVGVGVRRARFAKTRRVGERLSTREHFTKPLHRVGAFGSLDAAVENDAPRRAFGHAPDAPVGHVSSGVADFLCQRRRTERVATREEGISEANDLVFASVGGTGDCRGQFAGNVLVQCYDAIAPIVADSSKIDDDVRRETVATR